jgi:hypothetical protein
VENVILEGDVGHFPGEVLGEGYNKSENAIFVKS